MDNELFKQQATEKIQEYCDALTEKPDYLALYIGKPPEMEIKTADLNALTDPLDPEYDERRYLRDNGILLFSCELITDKYKVKIIEITDI